MMLPLPRRATLLGLTSILALGRASLAVGAAPTEKRLVVVLLRGALDGLAAVAPYGDPGLAALRPDLAPPPPGQENGLLDLGGMFGMHPALAQSHAMYGAGELLVVHAVAGPTRARSHFEAQDCLESGAGHRLSSGWLNRVAMALAAGSLTSAGHPASRQVSSGQAAQGQAAPGQIAPGQIAPGQAVPGQALLDRAEAGQSASTQAISGQAATRPMAGAIAIGASVPLLLRGQAEVANWAPHGFAEPEAQLYQSILALNRGDPVTGPALAAGLRDRGFGASVTGDMGKGGERFAFPALARAAGAMLRAPNGPRLAALELGGWDTHAAQTNRLAPPLRQLDAGLAAMKESLGEAWAHTIVLVLTEFGRTVRGNGTGGTDHGTASIALAAGGTVNGGRVAGTWPGLGAGQLHEDRDLAPTTDARSVVKGVLAAHLGLGAAAQGMVFPDSGSVQPMAGMVRIA